ncbi:MAG: segregation/condensation protein A [Alphaproteobacteria bacterium]|nr:segregation/condensation protein A [Alphaproteobacteria bacterium]
MTRDAIDDFEDPAPAREPDEAFVVRLQSYEGPLDVLLDKAREQRVDLREVSILDLAEQYLGFVERARHLRIELAADYLLMAAWLAYLKSRLLLPEPPKEGEEPSPAAMADALAFHLRRLDAMRTAGQSLMARPRLGVDIFARGRPEETEVVRSVAYEATLFELLKAYARLHRRTGESPALRIEASRLMSIEQALRRLEEALGALPAWTSLERFLPQQPAADPLEARSTLAATFAASLELARTGKVELQQDAAFAPLYLRSRRPQS